MPILNKLKQLASIFILRIKLRKVCRIAYSSNITKRTICEGMNQIFGQTFFDGYLGYGSYIGNNVNLSAIVGRFCSIAPFVRCNSGTHPYQAPFVSTAPCFCTTNPSRIQNGGSFANRDIFVQNKYIDSQQEIAIKIGHDCWIGEGAFIVGGVEIGNGAVVLAHAVVTKDVPAYAIVGGVPAKVIDYRFDDETIAFLQKVEWWNNSQEWFRENWELLCNIENLKTYYNKL